MIVTASTGNYNAIIAHEVSGITATSPVDATSFNTNSLNSGAAATQAGGDYIFGFAVTINNHSYSAGTGYALRANVPFSGSYLASEDQVQAAAGSVTATFGGTAGSGSASLVAFKAAASGGGSGDTTAPSVPTNLSASAVSSSQINLSWTASTDNVGVAGYTIYRNGSQIATFATNSYSDTGLTASTQYTYTVDAYDAAGNHSSQSTSASATTQSAPLTSPAISSFTANPASITSRQQLCLILDSFRQPRSYFIHK